MKQRRTILVLLLSLTLALTACGRADTPHVPGTGPGRMVRRIEVTLQPEDPDLARTYVTQVNMNDLLALLRSMETQDYPETEPDLQSGQSYYCATVTFSNGEQTVYYLLGHTYLRLGDNPWCLIDSSMSRKFVEFIRAHPSDDGSPATETVTVPAE